MSNDLERSILQQQVIANFETFEEDGRKTIAEYLDSGGDPNLMDPRFGMSLLILCVQEGAEELVGRLLALGADPNLPNEFDFTALHSAIVHEWRRLADGGPRSVVLETPPWKPMYEKLIAAGADVNSTDYKQETPLHLAARRGLTHVAKFLVESGADLYARNDIDQTPYEVTTDVRAYLQDAMQRHPDSPDLSWFDIDDVFDGIRGCLRNLANDLAELHPQQQIVASFVCLRLISNHFPKHLSANFCKDNLARVKELFYDCYDWTKRDQQLGDRDAWLAYAEREFALFEERIRQVPDQGSTTN